MWIFKFIRNFRIKRICKKNRITNYTINSDGSIHAHQNVFISNSTYIPLKFNIVDGFFDCSGNKLTSLKGCPKEVGSWFDCSNNNLISLEYSPIIVGGDFNCNYNNLTNLKYAPKSFEKFKICYKNKLDRIVNSNMSYIGDIVKYQDDYSIWNKNGIFNKHRFEDMMIEIKEERKILKS